MTAENLGKAFLMKRCLNLQHCACMHSMQCATVWHSWQRPQKCDKCSIQSELCNVNFYVKYSIIDKMKHLHLNHFALFADIHFSRRPFHCHWYTAAAANRNDCIHFDNGKKCLHNVWSLEMETKCMNLNKCFHTYCGRQGHWAKWNKYVVGQSIGWFIFIQVTSFWPFFASAEHEKRIEQANR